MPEPRICDDHHFPFSNYLQLDPLQDHTLMAQESGRDVRETEEIWHDQRDNQPKPTVTRHRPEPRVLYLVTNHYSTVKSRKEKH